MSTSLPCFPRLARKRLVILLPLILLLLSLAPVSGAQQAAKRAITHNDYDSWRSITGQAVSPDGKYLAYAVFPQEGSDGEVAVRELATGREVRQPAGELPPPPPANPDAEQPARAPSVTLAFTGDSTFLVFSTFPAHDDVVKAKKERKPADQMPKSGMVIVELATGKVTRIADVKSFQVPSKSGKFMAYLKQPKPAERPATPAAEKAAEKAPGDSDADQVAADQRGGARGGRAGAGNGRAQYGTEFVIHDLSGGMPDEVFQDVLDFTITKDASAIVYTVSSRKEEQNGVFAIAANLADVPAALLKGKGKYSRLTWDLKQTQLVFLSDHDDAAAKQPKYKVYYWDRKAPKAEELISQSVPSFRSGFVISPNGALSFSRDGSRLFLGCAPPAPVSSSEPDAQGSSASAAPVNTEDKVSMDLWHWRDDYIQPMQKVRASQDRNRSYRAVYHLASKKFVQLADVEMPEVVLPDEGAYAVGADDRLYRRALDYDPQRYADYYAVDVNSGERKPLGKKLPASGGRGAGSPLSPDGRYLLFYANRNWQTMRIPEGTVTNLTANRRVTFWSEEDDHPSEPPAYGTAGWTNDSKSVLLYDRYDVWQISADGKTAKNLTAGAGRAQNVQLRVTRLETEDEDEPRGIDPHKPLLLRGENLETRDSGFWRSAALDASGQTTAPQKLIAGPKSYRTVAKAKDADVVILTASTFNEFPDLQVTDMNFREPRKVTDANPQKAQLLWGTAELIRFKNADGVPLQAALYKPENFDPSKKYPLLVYIYERLSQNVHTFVPPRPGHSINLSYYVSNGYLVLTPDIIYKPGHPGQSALKCVLPAIQTVVDKGFVNAKAIGIQGHSWGGYQIAYMVTQTNRFAAAEAGAPVANMFSAYNGVRWGSGMPRQFQYEKDQSRIGATPWQAPALYQENSALFFADRVQTPLLILHNDADDAVPWYQGIELFLSLRRFGKEAYLMVYNGEPHGIRKRINQKDYTMRMQQFFDHKLKGGPMPDWMERGVPYIERDQEKEKFRAAVAASDGR